MSAGHPFSPRAALGLIAAGALAFVAMLYAIGAGLTGGGNDGGGHALSKGLTGFAALAALLEGSGSTVRRSRDSTALKDPGVLVLTPPLDADGDEVQRIVEARRRTGPTLLVLPKWVTVPAQGERAKRGWTRTAGTAKPQWVSRFDLGTDLGAGRSVNFAPVGGQAPLAAPGAALALTWKEDVVLPLVRDARGRTLIAYLNDDGVYPALDDWAGWDPPDKPDRGLFPVVIVAEPDLLNNQGLADKRTALNAFELIRRIKGKADTPIAFDVTLNGLGRGRNLLTLAFTPPFLAATLALLLAAFVAGWRAFVRFGPPRRAGRTIAFGKAALVENSAGLIRRTGRIRLLGAPYAALVGQRIAHALGLPASAPPTAIDAAQARRGIGGPAFSELGRTLGAARRSHDLVRHAAALHAIEKGLSR